MRVVSTFFAPSSILHSVKCRLDESGLEYLVISKPTKLEVYALEPEGAKFRCSLDVWGILSSLKVVPNEDNPDNLLVTTETPDPLVLLLEYLPEEDDDLPRLRVSKHLSLHSSFSRTMEHFEGAVIHPSGDVAVIATYIGKLKALELKGVHKKTFKSEFDCILTELNVVALCFLPVSVSSEVYVLAILHRDYTGTLQLLARDLSLLDQELSVEPSSSFPQVAITDDNARILLAISSSGELPAGILVLGGQTIFYYEAGDCRTVEKGKGKEKNTKGKGHRKSGSMTSGVGAQVEPRAQVDWPLSDLTAYAFVDVDGSRILLGDKFGKLCILSIKRTNSEVSLAVVRLGETSPATTITYLDSGVIFVGSHSGDSQITRISPSPDPVIGTQLDILDTFKNLAPIMDAVLIDTENTGQPHIITCSGGHNTGSLRIIRNGADLQELAVVENVGYIKSMWPLKFSYEARFDNILAISTLQATQFYLLSNPGTETIEELDEHTYPGFSHEPTLAISNMASVVSPGSDESGPIRYEDSQHVVQVTSTGIFLINLFTGMRDSTWEGETQIVAASINASQIVVALKGRKLVVLMAQDAKLVELRTRVFDDGEISAVTVHPFDPSLPFSNYIAVGFYGSNTVSIIPTADLMHPVTSPISMPHLPVSLLLCQFGLGSGSRRRPTGHSKNYPTHLLVGLGDGNLHAYALDFIDGMMNLSDQKLVPLGSTKPVFLTPFPMTSEVDIPDQNVLACGDLPIVLYWDGGRLKNSPLVRKGIRAACSLNSKEFPSSIVFSAAIERDGKVEISSLLIGRIRELHKLHIRTIPFGLDNPVRIAHHPKLRVFGIGCQRTQPHRVGEFPLESCSFKIIDDTTFEQLHHFPCEPDEELTIVRTLSLSLRVGESAGCKNYLIVGTQYYQAGETEAREGRILLFEECDPWLPKPARGQLDTTKRATGTVGLATASKVKGCVFALAEMDGYLVAAINESVCIFRLKPTQGLGSMSSVLSFGMELEEIAKWTHNYVVANMVTRGDRIYIGDAISSLSVVQWNSDTRTLSNIARDYAPLWPVGIESLNENNILGCNNDCNLFVFYINAANKRLEQVGNYYLGDIVNKFIHGALTAQTATNEGVRPEQMFVTSTGRIGIISEFDEKISLQMTALQRNLENVVTGPGGVKHSRWRAPKNARGVSDAVTEASGFLDGDFLEQLLDFSKESIEVKKALQGNTAAEILGMSFSEVVHVLEQLQNVH